MAIVLKVTKGKSKGTEYSYNTKEAILVGRANDCQVRFDEITVSRYHCMLDVSPPFIVVRDFGSLNGTYLNNKLIGKRPRDMEIEAARKLNYNEFEIKDGDLLGLGSDCEISFLLNSRFNDEEESEIIMPSEKVGHYKQYPHDYSLIENHRDLDINKYKKIRLLGEGGMGEVWLVEDIYTGLEYALKSLHKKTAGDNRSKAMFAREIMIAKQLNHPNVVKIINSVDENDIYYFIMEFCPYGDVDSLVEELGGSLSIDMATNIIMQVLDGLMYAHSAKIELVNSENDIQIVNGIVHRDLKPSNILIMGKNSIKIKIADFGLAKSFEMAGFSGLTRTGAFGGTPIFMPRQQILNYRYPSEDVDVWAAVATYYYMLTGQSPKDLSGDDPWVASLLGSAVPIRKRKSSIPKSLATVIDKALIDNPAIGYRTAKEFKEAIETVLSHK